MNRRRARTDIWGYLGGLFSSITFPRASSALLCPSLSPPPPPPPTHPRSCPLWTLPPSSRPVPLITSSHLSQALFQAAPPLSVPEEKRGERDGFRDTVASFPSRFLLFVIVRRKMRDFFLFFFFFFFRFRLCFCFVLFLLKKRCMESVRK